MKERRRTGIIAFIVLLSVVGLSYIFLNISFIKEMFSELLKQLFLMFLYAAIPCVPAVILRAIFGPRALKWIVYAATVLGGLCCVIHIILPEEFLQERVVVYETASVIVYKYVNEWIFIFTQFALISSAPALYCAAFVGDLYCLPFVKKERTMLVVLAPSLMFFLSLFIRQLTVKDFGETLEFIFDESVILLMIMSIVYAVWALIMIFVAKMIYKFVDNRLKIIK